MKILFTNVGRRTYMLQFALELLDVFKDLEIYVSDAVVETAGFWYDSRIKSFITPRVRIQICT